MTQICHRLWTLAREPEGPLVRYLDIFAESLDGEGFKQPLIGRQIRIAADFSRWLQSQVIPVECKRGLMAAYRFAPKIWDPASP